MASCGTFQKNRRHKGGRVSDIAELTWYYLPIGYSDEVFERSMVWHVVPNQELPLVPSQKVIGLPHLVHILPHELVSYRIFVRPLQVGGYLVWGIGRS